MFKLFKTKDQEDTNLSKEYISIYYPSKDHDAHFGTKINQLINHKNIYRYKNNYFFLDFLDYKESQSYVIHIMNDTYHRFVFDYSRFHLTLKIIESNTDYFDTRNTFDANDIYYMICNAKCVNTFAVQGIFEQSITKRGEFTKYLYFDLITRINTIINKTYTNERIVFYNDHEKYSILGSDKTIDDYPDNFYYENLSHINSHFRLSCNYDKLIKASNLDKIKKCNDEISYYCDISTNNYITIKQEHNKILYNDNSDQIDAQYFKDVSKIYNFVIRSLENDKKLPSIHIEDI